MPSRLSRRTFLKNSVIGGAGLALAACAVPAAAPGTAGESDTTGAASQESVTIRFMSRAESQAIPVYEDLLTNDFRSAHGNVDVVIEPAPDGWEEKLLAQMAAGAAVDIFQAWGNIFYNWTERNLILDVQPYVDLNMTEEEIADYAEFQWEGLNIRGIRAGMPKYINVMTVTVRKDLFEKYGVDLPPEDGNWTWEEYAETAQQLTDGARAAGEESQWGGMFQPWNWDRFWYWVNMFGGQVVDQKYGTVCGLGSLQAQEALHWMYDLVWTQNSFAQQSQIENMWFANALPADLVCMAEDSTYPIRLEDMWEAAFPWDIRHVPTGPTGERTVLGTTDAWAISAGTEHPEEAWDVLQYMAGPKFQLEAVAIADGRIPVLKSLMGDFVHRVREVHPHLAESRLETIPEIFEWGYAEDAFWFKDQNAAAELIRPALEAVFVTGSATPDLFIEVAEQVTEAQQAA